MGTDTHPTTCPACRAIFGDASVSTESIVSYLRCRDWQTSGTLLGVGALVVVALVANAIAPRAWTAAARAALVGIICLCVVGCVVLVVRWVRTVLLRPPLAFFLSAGPDGPVLHCERAQDVLGTNLLERPLEHRPAGTVLYLYGRRNSDRAWVFARGAHQPWRVRTSRDRYCAVTLTDLHGVSLGPLDLWEALVFSSVFSEIGRVSFLSNPNYGIQLRGDGFILLGEEYFGTPYFTSFVETLALRYTLLVREHAQLRRSLDEAQCQAAADTAPRANAAPVTTHRDDSAPGGAS